jgi:hypothetical protein
MQKHTRQSAALIFFGWNEIATSTYEELKVKY